MEYEKYDILKCAEFSFNYLTRMVDKKYDYLPYWLISVNEVPAWAKHCRVDDAELVASWYEGLTSVREMLGTEEGREVEEGFKKHLLRSWGKDGLRYHENYPWTNTMHASFHEMAYILSALNRWQAQEPDNKEVDQRAGELVRGMRSLVYERKTRVFWSGDFPFEEKVYEFPNDIYLQDRGWDFTCVTGRGEQSIRNGMMLHALVKRWQLTGDKVALDLAEGVANHLLELSRYFNYKGQFFGHVHSAVWFASGLVLLGRLSGEERYVAKGRNIYEYVLSLSSSFGWVPEYAQWHPMREEHCESCCIKDMIECSFELIKAGFEQYWDVINRFARNQLAEQQIKDGSFVSVDNSREDTPDTTFKDIDQRVVGGYSGGAEPNSISLARFRSIAGCCCGVAPQAVYLVWKNIVIDDDGRVVVNLPIEKDGRAAKIEIGYPNEGMMIVTAKKKGDYLIRTFPFMGERIRLTVNGKVRNLLYRGRCLEVTDVKTGDKIKLEHNIEEIVSQEKVRGTEYEVTWKGCDVVDLNPPGLPLRLYQRKLGVPKEIPRPTVERGKTSGIVAKPTV